MKNHLAKINLLFLLLFTAIYAQANIPSGLIGKWTDGDVIIEITSDQEIRIYQNDILTKEGSFTCDQGGFVETNWYKDLKPQDEYYFLFGSDWLAHEGGDFLTKLPDNVETDESSDQEKDYSGEINSTVFIEYVQKCWKNISWVYGEWEIPADHPSGKTYSVRITPFYYQEIKDEVVLTNNGFSKQPKKWYNAKEGYHSSLGDVVYINNLYLDFAAKRIYCVLGVDKKVYMTQTAEYTTTKAKTIFWIITSIIGVGILIGLFFLIRKLIRLVISIVKTLVTWTKTQWNKTRQKVTTTIQTAGANTKKQWNKTRQKVTSTIQTVGANTQKQWDETIKPKATSAIKDIGTSAESLERNITNNKNIMKNLLKIGAVVFAAIWLLGKCSGCSEDSGCDSGWVGVYEESSWRFELKSDGTAHVDVDDLSYDTTWEDGGNWAVVGAHRGEVFLISKSGDLSIMGKNGHTTSLFRLRKTK